MGMVYDIAIPNYLVVNGGSDLYGEFGGIQIPRKNVPFWISQIEWGSGHGDTRVCQPSNSQEWENPKKSPEKHLKILEDIAGT